MASFNGNGRNDGPKRRPGDPRRSRHGRPIVEALEQRRLLDGAPTGPIWHATTTDLSDVKNGPMANLGSDLIRIYTEFYDYSRNGSQGTFVSSKADVVTIRGNSVGVSVRGTGDFLSFHNAMTNLGFQVTAASPSLKMIDGFIPIHQLPSLATQAQLIAGSPLYRPLLNSVGSANNQAERTLFADTARTNFGVTGAGVKIGVLSDSVDRFGSGLAGSVASGDLPGNVQVLSDGTAGDTDEGRAMLEQIYDIAPGASLAFATSGDPPSALTFASNIRALAAAGSSVIVDDVGLSNEPFFQDGIIVDAINSVTAAGAVYLTAAGNSADGGYLSQFRGVTATVGSIGSGRFMNFDGSGAGVQTLLPVVVTTGGSIIFQFAQPFYTTAGVTSDLDFFVLNQAGTIIASGATNNVATLEPLEFLQGIAPGSYNIAIQVKSGPDPSNVVFYGFGADLDVSRTFGSAGQTFYPTAFGHSSSANAISVGAVPWFGAPPDANPSPIRNESFSSFGPSLRLFNFNGTAATPTYQLKPDISAPDGNNTSFFGSDINTTLTSPSTPTNLDPDLLPNFFGTSSAAPNLAAAVALMKQSVPTLNRTQILSAFIATATPLNGSARGVWDPQGGFGLANANAAIASVQATRVASITPGGGQVVATSPTAITVQFTRPILFSSVSAGDLIVIGANGATVVVGAPVAVDNPNTPTVVRFPITIIPAPGQIANGVYTLQIASGAFVAADGAAVEGVTDTFNLQQTSAPRVVGTGFDNRFVGIRFDVPMNPATINPDNVFLVRAGALNGSFDPSTSVVVSRLPGAVLAYDAASNTALLNLTALDQTLLPSDHYALVVTSGVTDSVGNPLNGSFNGIFPSGTTPGSVTNFVQDLGNRFVQGPIITALGLTSDSDSGIKGDQNTNVATPSLAGRIQASFLGTVAGVTIYARFNGIVHPGTPNGTLDLGPGANGRGIAGTFDAVALTDANGFFRIQYPAGVAPLPDGLNRARIQAVAPTDIAGQPGLSTALDTAFRVDRSLPFIGTTNGSSPSSIPQNSRINGLTSITLQVIDPINPQSIGDPFVVPTSLTNPALDPVATASVSNYSLTQVVPNGAGGVNLIDRSSFIASATFNSTTVRTFATDPYTGTITLTFTAGLQAGRYVLIAKSAAGSGIGLQDAAGNNLTNSAGASAVNGAANYVLDFDIEPTPVYITGSNAYAFDPNINGMSITGPRAFYEIARAGTTPRATPPPTQFSIDFSTSLNPAVNYNDLVRLVRSANTPGGAADGNFGDLGTSNSNGFTRIAGATTVTLINSVPGAGPGQFGYQNRLLLDTNGTTLPADYYRIHVPNRLDDGTAIFDVFGNQLDGEFLGYQDANGKFVNLLPTGRVRGSGASEVADLSGDLVAGGSFTTGFVIVPNGNIIYARPDYVDDPFIISDDPDGSIARPFAALAPEATASTANGGNLNFVSNFGPGFNLALDRNGNGRFDRSALFAAQQRTLGLDNNNLFNPQVQGPAVVILQPALSQRNPITGVVSQNTFVLQAPAGANAITNDASTSVPALTTLAFQAGSTLKMLNASLFVQNQGSALQILGGANPGQRVTITSYKDDTVGGDTNNDRADSAPVPGDYGGLVFRNFTQQGRTSNFTGQIPSTGIASIDNRLKRVVASGGTFTLDDAITGSDDVMSIINFMTETYGGGAVPATVGTRYDGVTLFNSRPAIVNSQISFIGGSSSLQAPISGDVDSFREDYIGRGPLIRNDSFVSNGLNGIYIRAQLNGVAQASNAVSFGTNPDNPNGAPNYSLDDPYPYILTSRLEVGSQFLIESGGASTAIGNRLYIQPGMLVKFQRGAALQVVSTAASLNVGDRTYLDVYDDNNQVGPTDAGFRPNTTGDAQVLFTSIYDDAATTSYFDPITQLTTTIVGALGSIIGGSGGLQPTPTNVNPLARWGGVTVIPGAVAVIDETNFRYGGGSINTAAGTGVVQALELAFGNSPFGGGARVSVTNNTFTSNADVPINIQPNGLVAGDAQRPLLSGTPFIHGNVFQLNDLNGVGVWEPENIVLAQNAFNLSVNSAWTGSDFTYIVRSAIVLGGSQALPLPANAATQLLPEPSPTLTLTLQSTPAGTLLADGSRVDLPGVPLLIKMQGQPATDISTVQTPNIINDNRGGAGFIVGVDDGVDPTADPLIDPGANSQIRILGIGADQSTGQTRVPVIMTSVLDNTVGTTVRNVPMFQVRPGVSTAPSAGDGGVLYFGGNSLTDYNMQDIRDGNVIDNADIRYMARIEQQGGGIIHTFDTSGDAAFNPTGSVITPTDPTPAAGSDFVFDQKLGLAFFSPTGQPNFSAQYNTSKNLTVSNSNLSSFRDFAFLAHPGYNAIAVAVNYPNTPPTYRGGFLGQATHTYFYNNTFSNMPNQTAVEIRSETGANGAFPSPAQAVFLNNTFYNVGTGINGEGPAGNLIRAHVSLLVMDNIFSTTQGPAITIDGQSNIFSQSNLQYNLFHNIANNAYVTGTANVGNSQPIFGDPMFRDAANGNFYLMSGSAAIDAARSEIGPTFYGDMLYPIVTTSFGNLAQIPVRNQLGNINEAGGLTALAGPEDIVTLPGFPIRSFPDQFRSVVQGTPGGTVLTPGGAVATNVFIPLAGERDQAGNLRVKSPTATTVGFGSRPFFDIGAFEYIVLNPPSVIGVTATTAALPGGTSIYTVGGVAGTSSAPTTINVAFDQQISPSTLNALTVLLLASGGDGIFGNGNSQADTSINLQGRLAFDPLTRVLTINTAGIITASDEYRIILKGTGSQVIRNPDGDVLDGENLDANGNQRALPSGDDFPGGDFQLTFTLDSSAPQIVANTFRLDPTSDTSGGRFVTRDSTPTFIGSVTDIFPPTNASQGLRVIVDISTTGDPNSFNLINAGEGTTDANGNFSVTLSQALPDTPVNVGADGIKGTADDLFSLARVRVLDQSGNASNQVTDPFSAYLARGAATGVIIDTVSPQVIGFVPAGNTVATLNANGQVIVTASFSETIEPTSLNSNTIQVIRAGGDGTFTDGNEVAVAINPGSFVFTNSFPITGQQVVQFALAGNLANDVYQITLVGTGTTPVTDIAKNPLNGGSNFVNGPITVFSPTLANNLFVSNNTFNDFTQPIGSRTNPYTTITGALTASVIGDQVLVLPGVYRENINLRAGVRLLSADLSSTDSLYVPGVAQQTLIYGGSNFTPGLTAVNAVNLATIAGIDTEISGFSIVAPLLFNSVTGPIDPTSNGIFVANSSVLIDKNFVINAGVGINVSTTSSTAPTPRIYSNGIIGNLYGIGISGPSSSPALVLNNTIADNTYGLFNVSSTPGVTQAVVLNNIFYGNFELTTARTGAGILSFTANTLSVGANLFQGNGPSQANSGDDALGVFTGFNPATLGFAPDAQGNYVGNAAFIAPRDPRPNGDTPAVFFLDGNYDLSLQSAAIDSALNAVAPASDFLSRGRVRIDGRGFGVSGPADIGAFEFRGTDGIAVGGQLLRVVTTSLSADGTLRSSGVIAANQVPSFIDIDISSNVDPSSVQPSDLVLSGTGLNGANPARATGLTWIDGHTVRFLLSGNFNTAGSVKVDIAAGAITDRTGRAIAEFSDSFQIGVAAPTTPNGTPNAPGAPNNNTPIIQPTTPSAPTNGKKAKAAAAAKAKAAAKSAAAAKAKAAAEAKAKAKAATKAKAAAKARAKAAAKVANQAKAGSSNGLKA